MTGVESIPEPGELSRRFAPLLDEIAAESIEADRRHISPAAQVRRLAEAGFTAARVPRELGGGGASFRQLFELLIELADADSNLAQILRQHFYHVETTLIRWSRGGAQADAERLRQIAGGLVIGAATTEPRGSVIGQIDTVVRQVPDGDGYRLDGEKIYTTGLAFADLAIVSAVDEQGNVVSAEFDSDRDGLELFNDWDGFGQRRTETSTARLRGVVLNADEVRRAPVSRGFGIGFHQLVLLAALAGVARAAVREAVREVQDKTRVYYTSSGVEQRSDPVVQTHIGRLEARSFCVGSVVLSLAESLGSAWQSWAAGDADSAVLTAFKAAEFDITKGQVVVSDDVLWITGHVLDTLGASSVSRDKGFDRHWRNARTLASHNSHLFKARVIGDNLINGTRPPDFIAGHDVGRLNGSVDPASASEH